MHNLLSRIEFLRVSNIFAQALTETCVQCQLSMLHLTNRYSIDYALQWRQTYNTNKIVHDGRKNSTKFLRFISYIT